ncbi:MAG: Phenylacetic acid catabolic protein, partial [bacterium]
MAIQSQIKIFDSTEGMSPACKVALRNLLLACADTKLLLGYHYGEWTFGPPEIEAAIACCSLCQTELGHVRLLYGILNKHYGDDPDALVASRKPEEFANISFLDNEIKDWAEFVAANYIVDLAVTTLLYSMQGSTFQPLH